MTRKQVIVQLSDDLIAKLDTEAARREVSRSALVREAVEGFLAEKSEAALVAKMVESYKAVPQEAMPEWEWVSAIAERGRRDMLRRLDEEEREAGFEPW